MPRIREIMSEGRVISKGRVPQMMGRVVEPSLIKGSKLALIKVIPTLISKEDRAAKMGRMEQMGKTLQVSKVVRDLEAKEIRPTRL